VVPGPAGGAVLAVVGLNVGEESLGGFDSGTVTRRVGVVLEATVGRPEVGADDLWVAGGVTVAAVVGRVMASPSSNRTSLRPPPLVVVVRMV
jgi:hypothetical protein